MKIGFDAKRAFHNFRGLGYYSRTLLEGLSFYYSENEYFLYTTPIKDERAIKWIKNHPGFRIVQPKGIESHTSSLWRSLKIPRELVKDDIDIYHGLSHEIPFGLKKEKNIKSVVTIHDLLFMKFPQFFKWVDRKVYFKKITYAIHNADLVLAICEQTKNDIIQLLDGDPDKIQIAYQSCNPIYENPLSNVYLEEIRKKYSLPEKIILQVGALEPNKNALTTIRAFSRLKGEIDHHLIFVGKGDQYKKTLEEEVLRHGLKKRVKFIDFVEDDLAAFYQLSDLFIFPSFYEGWGIPNVEALTSGVPVITSMGGCFSESAGLDSLFINPHSSEDLTEKMAQVLFDETLRLKMIQEGKRYAKKFSLESTSRSLITYYQSLLV